MTYDPRYTTDTHRSMHSLRSSEPEIRERLARVEEASRYQRDRLDAHHDRLTTLARAISGLQEIVYRNKEAIARLVEQVTPMLAFVQSVATWRAAVKMLLAAGLFIGVATGRLTQDAARDWRDWVFAPASTSTSRR